MNWLAIFVQFIVLDVVFAIYTRSVASGAAMVGALAAFGICWLSANITLAYVGDPLLIWPACAGAFVGTYIAVWFK